MHLYMQECNRHSFEDEYRYTPPFLSEYNPQNYGRYLSEGQCKCKDLVCFWSIVVVCIRQNKKGQEIDLAFQVFTIGVVVAQQ